MHVGIAKEQILAPDGFCPGEGELLLGVKRVGVVALKAVVFPHRVGRLRMVAGGGEEVAVAALIVRPIDVLCHVRIEIRIRVVVGDGVIPDGVLLVVFGARQRVPADAVLGDFDARRLGVAVPSFA